MSPPHPRILGLGTANPPYRVRQGEAREIARAMFRELEGIERLIGVFENTGIETRYVSAPVEWFTREHGFAEKNRLWQEVALELAHQASREALERARVSPQRIGAVVLVTTTGIATPGLEAHLVQRLGIPLSAIRLPIWGLGCAGGAAGLARAAELARLHPKACVLLVAVELCSLTFIRGDLSRANLVATSLFADGAAAVVLGSGEGPEVVGGFSRLLPESYEVMGWEVTEPGLQVRFAQSIPRLVEEGLADLIKDGLAAHGLKAREVGVWVLHPGGSKVLAAYRQALPIDERSYEASRSTLREYGNMSSPTVLFVLERLLGRVERGARGVLLALGPGFAAEGVVLRW
jgi:alkylresorcinol/alkylpyrone synthase